MKYYESTWLASNIWIRDVFLLSDLSTFGAGSQWSQPKHVSNPEYHKHVSNPEYVITEFNPHFVYIIVIHFIHMVYMIYVSAFQAIGLCAALLGISWAQSTASLAYVCTCCQLNIYISPYIISELCFNEL